MWFKSKFLCSLRFDSFFFASLFLTHCSVYKLRNVFFSRTLSRTFLSYFAASYSTWSFRCIWNVANFCAICSLFLFILFCIRWDHSFHSRCDFVLCLFVWESRCVDFDEWITVMWFKACDFIGFSWWNKSNDKNVKPTISNCQCFSFYFVSFCLKFVKSFSIRTQILWSIRLWFFFVCILCNWKNNNENKCYRTLEQRRE